MVARVHNVYMERECLTLHILCTNTLCKVMMQLPLTAKVLITFNAFRSLFIMTSNGHRVFSPLNQMIGMEFGI